MCPCAGLRRLQTLEVGGLLTLGEERPGLLNEMLEGISSLHLRGQLLLCSDITSPSLRCLTLLFPMAGLQGAGPAAQRAFAVHGSQAQQAQGAAVWVHAVGACPQLEVLQHSANCVTAAHLRQYTRLLSLSDLLCAALPTPSSFVTALTPLTRLQHLRLTQCALLGCFLSLNSCFTMPRGVASAVPVYRHVLKGLCHMPAVSWLAIPLCIGGIRYQGGAGGFSEMLLFAGLRSLRLQLDNPPDRLFLAKEFSQLTELTMLELDQSVTAIHYGPTFSAAAPSKSCQWSIYSMCLQPAL